MKKVLLIILFILVQVGFIIPLIFGDLFFIKKEYIQVIGYLSFLVIFLILKMWKKK